MDAQELEAPAPYDGINSLKKGIWSSWEDSLLVNYIALHGEGRWNYVARDSGLKRTGKSCRLRWKNYLCPTVRRGNFTVEEQLRIADLHRLLGNRWSKIAEFLWGRTDNEIKNYWRTRPQKQTKHLKYDTESVEVREFTRNVRLSEQIHASNNNNNLMMNEAFGSEALQMDYWPSSFSCEAVKARDVTTSSDSLYMITNNDCEFFSTDDSFEPNLGEHYYDPLSPNSESPGCWFSYGELSNMLLNDDWCNF